MNIFMYKYDCPTWYWNYSGVKNLYTDDKIDVNKARELALEKRRNYQDQVFVIYTCYNNLSVQ